MVREGIAEGVKSEAACTRMGRCLRRSRGVPRARSWAWTSAAACFTRQDDEMEFCSITSDMVRFFKIGFLAKNEFVLDSRLGGSETCGGLSLFEPGWRGPYSQVTSHSLDLRKSITHVPPAQEADTHQFNVSGLTVLRRNWFLAHVRHEAFSRRERSP